MKEKKNTRDIRGKEHVREKKGKRIKRDRRKRIISVTEERKSNS